jgi:hypothetical protein
VSGAVVARQAADAGDRGDPVVFELRQVRLPAGWSGWQRAAWLDGQAILWGELGLTLDGAGGVVESGADEVSNNLAALSLTLVKRLMACGEPVPDHYVTAVDAVVSRVSTADVSTGQDVSNRAGRLAVTSGER